MVYIVEKKHSRAATGFLKFLPDKPFAMFSPADHRLPRINVPLSDCPPDFGSRPADFANTLYICRITSWEANSNFAEGWVLPFDLGARFAAAAELVPSAPAAVSRRLWATPGKSSRRRRASCWSMKWISLSSRMRCWTACPRACPGTSPPRRSARGET